MSLLSILSVTHPSLFPLLLCSLSTPSTLKSHYPSHIHASPFLLHSTCVLLCSPELLLTSLRSPFTFLVSVVISVYILISKVQS